MSAYQGLILASDLSCAEEGVHTSQSCVGACKYNKTRGVHTQSVNNHFIHTSGFRTVAVEDSLIKGGVGFVLSRHGENTRWLAYNYNVLILKNNIKVLK